MAHRSSTSAPTRKPPMADAILTATLPSRCPACAKRDPTMVADALGLAGRWHLQCACGYHVTYQVRSATAGD